MIFRTEFHRRKPSPLETEEGVVVPLIEICEWIARSSHYLQYWLINFIEKRFKFPKILESLEIFELFIRFLKIFEVWGSL